MDKSKINYINSQDVDLNDATPMMRQYLEIKRKSPGAVLLYRMGDFYEAFFEDAVLISRDLEITLTQREGGQLGRVPMAGVPVKSIDNYIAKLIEKKHKISICEQLENPAEAKGLVKRDIVKTITAGTLTDSNLLQSTSNNYLLAVFEDKAKRLFGIAYTDISTGEFKITQATFEQTIAELARINPAEVLTPAIPQKTLPFQIVPDEKIDLPEEIIRDYNCTKVHHASFNEEKAKKFIKDIFNVATVDSFGAKECRPGIIAAGAVLEYLVTTQKDHLPKFGGIELYELSQYVSMDANTRKNLELTETAKDKSKIGSLLWAISKTKTNMGERLLKKWITQPLKDTCAIQKRLDATEELVKKPKERAALSALLERVYDIERLSSKVSNNSANARDFLALKDSLKILPEFDKISQNFNSELINNGTLNNPELQEFAQILEKTIDENPPIAIKEGGIIKKGVNGELDYYKDLLTGGEKWLVEFEEKEKEKTGIKFLKVGFSKTFGYFIEISNSGLNLVPKNYIRRQTLSNGERYITEDLKKHENEVLSASSKRVELEYKIFTDLREYAKEFVEPVRQIAAALSTLDVILTFASTAIESNYSKPEITDSLDLLIKNGRHPVVEKLLPMGQYVPNDLSLCADVKDAASTQFMILTGPNMAGKSTYMRQNALIVIMAQIGCFVPADYARIGVVDKIFTRVGAVDDLSLGQSTFMVEMSETAFIVNSATEKSLILLDEIGRGTSTYDGVAIAWAVTEHIAAKIKSRAIFSTHYHELNVMAKTFPQIKNYRITITEEEGHIEFLRKVIEGSASKSYGIQVAKMAGLPKTVIDTAEKLMIKMQKAYYQDLSKNKKRISDDELAPQLTLSFNDFQ